MARRYFTRAVIHFSIILTLLCSLDSLAHSRLLRVAVVADPTVRYNEKISIQTWDRLSQRLNYHYQLYAAPNVNAALALIQKHKVDVAIGLPPPDTAWPGIVFINSYLENNVGIVLPQKMSLWRFLLPYVKVIFGTAIGILLLLTTIIGILIWLAEHKSNSAQFPKEPWRGVANGFWYALATMTGVGYGDITPRSFLGRVVGTLWLLVTFIAASSFTVVVTAELASARIAQGQINSPTELQGDTVSYRQFSESVKLLINRFYAIPMATPTEEDAVAAVNQGKAAAAFLNLIELRCHSMDNPNLQYNLSSSRISLGYYAMAVPVGSDLPGRINQALYFMNQEGIVRELEKDCQ